MQRRPFLRLSLRLSALTPIAGAIAGSPLAHAHNHAGDSPGAGRAASDEGWRTYDITTRIDLAERTAQGKVWIPLPAPSLGAGADRYQQETTFRFDAPGAAEKRVLTTPEGARVLFVRWDDSSQPQQVELVNRVQLRDRATDLTGAKSGVQASPTELRHWLQPSSLKPLDGVVGQTAKRIVADAGARTDFDKARAIYDWIVANGHRVGSVRGCGTGDVAYLLTTGNLGGKCADLNGLFVALARASGVPARDVYGVRVDDSAHGYKSLGKSGDITKAQHCRAEFYAQGYGWVPVDPADVRKVMLEEAPGGLPKIDARVRAANAMLFGAWEMNWLGYGSAEDVRLPSSQQTPPLGFLMYPVGETAQGRLDSLDPANFRYTIQSRRV